MSALPNYKLALKKNLKKKKMFPLTYDIYKNLSKRSHIFILTIPNEEKHTKKSNYFIEKRKKNKLFNVKCILT